MPPSSSPYDFSPGLLGDPSETQSVNLDTSGYRDKSFPRFFRSRKTAMDRVSLRSCGAQCKAILCVCVWGRHQDEKQQHDCASCFRGDRFQANWNQERARGPPSGSATHHTLLTMLVHQLQSQVPTVAADPMHPIHAQPQCGAPPGAGPNLAQLPQGWPWQCNHLKECEMLSGGTSFLIGGGIRGNVTWSTWCHLGSTASAFQPPLLTLSHAL